MSRRSIALLLLVIGIISFFSAKDNSPMKAEIQQLTMQKEAMLEQINRAAGRTPPVALNFDETRYRLRSLSLQPAYAAYLFTYAVTASSPAYLAAKISFVKNILPYTYISKIALDSKGPITATMVTKEAAK